MLKKDSFEIPQQTNYNRQEEEMLLEQNLKKGDINNKLFFYDKRGLPPRRNRTHKIETKICGIKVSKPV